MWRTGGARQGDYYMGSMEEMLLARAGMQYLEVPGTVPGGDFVDLVEI